MEISINLNFTFIRQYSKESRTNSCKTRSGYSPRMSPYTYHLPHTDVIRVTQADVTLATHGLQHLHVAGLEISQSILVAWLANGPDCRSVLGDLQLKSMYPGQGEHCWEVRTSSTYNY